MNTPLISIILPTYNVAEHIERCLNSCLSQEFTDYEIIIVDDCGTDSSIEIANAYASKDSRIKIIKHEKNLGTYHARKTGTFNAKGCFVLYLDPDDELAENALNIIYKQIKNNPKLDLLLFNSKYIPSHNFLSSKPCVPLGLFENNIPCSILQESKLTYGTPGKLYSKRALIEGFNELSIPENIRLVFGEDILIFASALLNTNCAVGLKQELYLYYRNETSITSIKDSGVINNNILQLDLVICYLKKLNGIKNINSCVDVIVERIELYKIGLRKELVSSNKEYLFFMLSCFLKTYSWKTLAKLMIFLASLTMIKR